MPQIDLAPVTAEELQQFPLFADESLEALAWIAGQMQVRRLEAGEILAREGDPVTEFQVILDGEIHFGSATDPNSTILVSGPGRVTGLLPFSRMKVVPGRLWAIKSTRVAAMHGSHLRELVYRAPILAQRLVGEMTDRTRAMTRREETSNRLLALGKLSAGLAHELNNPASAAVRSSARLREVLVERRRHALALRGVPLSERARQIMIELSDRVDGCAVTPGGMDALERSDLECNLADWLEASGVPAELASGLVDAGITADQLRPIAALVPAEGLELGLRILVADQEVFCLTRELEEASRRMSDLVKAVKAYSYMDQSPLTDVDIEQGLDVTLRMFQHQLKQGVEVIREFAQNVPRIRANGSELNQVWTNLIDNALDAMESLPPEQPRILRLTTCAEPSEILVEIADTGPGIPPEAQDRIFEPFFTTKGVGKGSGLGLDIVYRIIRNHKASIRVESSPGRTVFQVRLPL